MTPIIVTHGMRNHRLVDVWSFIHLAAGILIALVLPPFWALVVMVLWEPLELLVLSPMLARIDILFGHESLKNSMMDVVFDVAGVVVGVYLVVPVFDPFGVGA